MLTTLRIKNLALVEDLTLELPAGFCAITGETGAGKSILIGALNLVLGERADRNLVRSGCESCAVEAVFSVARLGPSFQALLAENGLEPCEEDQLVLKRVFTLNGTNRQFVNGSPATLAVLARLGEGLVDIHGPHDHQSLLAPARQLAILDAYARLAPVRAAFAELLRQRTALAQRKAGLIIDEPTYAQQLDLWQFQTREIESAGLQPGEEEQLQEEYRRGHNSARLLELTHAALGLLGEADDNLLAMTGALGRTLHDLQKLDPAIQPLADRQQQLVVLLQELQQDLSRYGDRIELQPARLQELEDRLNLIQALKRKYGPTVAAVIASGETARASLVSLQQREAELEHIQAAQQQLEAQLWQAGQALSEQRRRILPALSKAVHRQLTDLGFQQSRFEIALASLDREALAGTDQRISLSGLDTVEFQFSPNPGEPLRALRAIASSGEMARVMLALKTVLAAEDEVPVLIFDEVDANIGGETANKVGEKLRQIARQRQVLCITHLAPVAVGAQAHFLVRKHLKAGRTLTEIARLEREDRVAELSRMLGGQSDAARHYAEALLKDAQPK